MVIFFDMGLSGMKEIEANKQAWGKVAEDHYGHYKEGLLSGEYKLNPMIVEELGDINGKTVLHLQCNTGADSIMLARMGAVVTGVDLVPDNIIYARKLAEDCGIEDIRFIESDIMTLMDFHHDKYDIVFTSEGVLIWLPDKKRWAETIRHCLKDDGFFYIHDGHPFCYIFDEVEFSKGKLIAKYPYFSKAPDVCEGIGGYAGERKPARTYEWMTKVSDIINSLAESGLFIEYMHECDRATYGMVAGAKEKDEEGLVFVKEFEGKVPVVFSLKAVVR